MLKENKYAVGDRVLVVSSQLGIKEMYDFVGKICTISYAGENVYELEEDQNRFHWLERWLESAEENTISVTEKDWDELMTEIL